MIKENKSSDEEACSALQMLSKLLGNGTGSVFLGAGTLLQSVCRQSGEEVTFME